MTKVTLPSDFAIRFYYNYSNFALFLTWLLFPVLLYLILTKSKELKAFKWFILNHSFWCFTYEFVISLIKPLILAPAPSGYPLGILRTGNPYLTGIATLVGIGLNTNCVIGISATIIDRYLLVFNTSATNCLNRKILLIVGIGFTVFINAWLIAICFLSLSSDIDTMLQDAIEYDNFFANFEMPSMYFMSLKTSMPLLSFVAVLMTFLIITGFATMSLFIYSVKTSKSATLAKLQKSLIISSAIQIIITCLFLLLPLVIGFINVIFQIPNTSTLICFLWCFIASHTPLEFITILYCVSPYRKFLKNVFRKAVLRKTVVSIFSVSQQQSVVTRSIV